MYYLKIIIHSFVNFPTRLVSGLYILYYIIFLVVLIIFLKQPNDRQCTVSLETPLMWWKLSLKMRPWQFSVANISNQITIFKSRGIFRNAKSKKYLFLLHLSNRSVFVNEDEANIRFVLFANSRWYRLIAEWKSLRGNYFSSNHCK